MDKWNSLRGRMEDAGCDSASIARAEVLCSVGAKEELIRCLRCCRCDQLDVLHEKQRQLDRLDDLIRNVQKM